MTSANKSEQTLKPKTDETKVNGMGILELTHPCIKDGWFREAETLWPGQAMSLKVNEILFQQQSQFQDVLVFQSSTYGNCLVLDGVIQATERDEFAYQEMIAHLPLNSHPDPKNILVIGGGDGGVLREIVKHSCVESVTLVEIDEVVVQVSQRFLPSMAAGFLHPKVNLIIGDGYEYLKSHSGEFDVIICDSSDPVGPAEMLFSDSFFSLMYEALREGGITCTQGECQWLHLPLIKKVLDSSKQLYPTVMYAYTSLPTYPSGQIGFVLCSKNPETVFEKPLRTLDKEVTRYYNGKVHGASFCLPQFVIGSL